MEYRWKIPPVQVHNSGFRRNILAHADNVDCGTACNFLDNCDTVFFRLLQQGGDSACCLHTLGWRGVYISGGVLDYIRGGGANPYLYV